MPQQRSAYLCARLGYKEAFPHALGKMQHNQCPGSSCRSRSAVAFRYCETEVPRHKLSMRVPKRHGALGGLFGFMICMHGDVCIDGTRKWKRGEGKSAVGVRTGARNREVRCCCGWRAMMGGGRLVCRAMHLQGFVTAPHSHLYIPPFITTSRIYPHTLAPLQPSSHKQIQPSAHLSSLRFQI
jgi:hypothetical protein